MDETFSWSSVISLGWCAQQIYLSLVVKGGAQESLFDRANGKEFKELWEAKNRRKL
jgi:hypothetical protein